ncbi:hypothetical protein AeMF1_011276 [Aphanomyces euteiches]|nr:hypothetical protein AeMF1_011276 [Aphanomyces euteiches]
MARVVRASIDPLIQLGLTPSQARGELSFTVPEDILPTLKQFQNRHQYVRTTQMLENSKPSIMREILLSKRFVADMSDTQYFTFGYDIIGESPQFGIGGPDDPFTVGVTTKTLLRQMNRDPASFVFHWDATYKINSKEFPVLVCGITDIARQFHPVAFFIISRETVVEYSWAMRELMAIYEHVVGGQLKLRYIMSDAAKAPALVIQTLYNDLVVETTLMCFYHCVANVHKKVKGLPLPTKYVIREVLDTWIESFDIAKGLW